MRLNVNCKRALGDRMTPLHTVSDRDVCLLGVTISHGYGSDVYLHNTHLLNTKFA